MIVMTRKKMTLQSDGSAAVHWCRSVAWVCKCAEMCKSGQGSGKKGWGGVHSKRYATLSIFGLPMGYSSIGSVRYI